MESLRNKRPDHVNEFGKPIYDLTVHLDIMSLSWLEYEAEKTRRPIEEIAMDYVRDACAKKINTY